jgi:hypothetical protein
MTPDERLVVRRALLKKGGEIADMLADFLSGKVPAGLGSLAGKPGERPEEKLRRWLNAVQARLDATEDPKCEKCGREIPFVELEQMPLADVCGQCAATGSGT